MTETIKLSLSVLRTLAEGIDRLNDGDDADRKAADETSKVLAQAGYVADNGQCYPISQTTSGYVQGEAFESGTHVFQTFDGSWSKPVEPGTTLFFDEECTIPLRTIDDSNEYVQEPDPDEGHRPPWTCSVCGERVPGNGPHEHPVLHRCSDVRGNDTTPQQS